MFIYLHLATLYGLYLSSQLPKGIPSFGVSYLFFNRSFHIVLQFDWSARFKDRFFVAALFMLFVGGYGITGGAHRLWAHRSYKAKWPLRLFTAVAQTLAVQNDIYEWSR